MHHDRSKTMNWLNERYNLSMVWQFVQEKKVPSFKGSFWYYFGGVSLFLFIVQVITGILLLMYYQPGAATAYESVRFIVTKVKFGWLIRSIHSWSANLMILSIVIHMFSVYFTKAFRAPRELTWYTGFLLFALSLAFGFSGYLLPWNTLSYFATKVGTEIIGVVPFIGKPLMELLRNGSDVTTATLTRFFGLHVAVFPAIFTIILGIHLLLIQVQGISEPESWKDSANTKKKYIPFFPNFVMRDILLWLIVLNVLAILAVYFPWDIGTKADPFAPAPLGIKPEWYFLFMFQTLKFFPAKIFSIDGEIIGVTLFGIAGLLWFFVPFWDTRTARGNRNKIINYVGITVIIYLIVLTIVGARG
jgi:cytochrome b6